MHAFTAIRLESTQILPHAIASLKQIQRNVCYLKELKTALKTSGVRSSYKGVDNISAMTDNKLLMTPNLNVR
jgi:hypothetical protein